MQDKNRQSIRSKALKLHISLTIFVSDTPQLYLLWLVLKDETFSCSCIHVFLSVYGLTHWMGLRQHPNFQINMDTDYWITSRFSKYCSMVEIDIKNNAWVTVNNDFLSRVRRFGNDFHEWRSHEWKSLTNRLTSDKNIVIHGNECIILFLTCYFMSWTHRSTKNYHWALISPLLPSAAFSDAALWRHHNWSVTSCEREILVLWRHICLLSLHVQIGAKAIFTSE